MNKESNQNRQPSLLIIITTIVILGAVTSIFAQKDKYPKPDFSAMEEYFEITEYEYDFNSGGIPKFIVVAKKKEKSVPRWWTVTWRDAKGIKINEETLMFSVHVNEAEVGEVVQAKTNAPWKRLMPTVKSVVIMESMNN